MIDRIKSALQRVKIAYWRRFRPSKYALYLASCFMEGMAEGAKIACSAMQSAAASCVVMAAKNAEQCGASADIVIYDELHPRKRQII